jgi:hypothetical protein
MHLNNKNNFYKQTTVSDPRNKIRGAVASGYLFGKIK